MGQVTQEMSGEFTFVYNDSWMIRGTFPISLSMPLVEERHTGNVVRSFLQGLLPDNDRVLEHWGQRFGVSPRNPLALLAHVGEDCAGAIQFVRPERLDVVVDVNSSSVDWLTESQIADRLRELYSDDTAWQAPQREGQFSLAGAQPKIALLMDKGRWGVPNGTIPTTHILKPPTTSFDGFAENEHFCLTLAHRIGLPTALSRVRRFDDQIAIVVERYDRIQVDGRLIRYHQEDCCQALGVSPFRKYENEGGPGVRSIVELLRRHSSDQTDDIRTFVSTLALNWVIGGTDAHAKNFSILLGDNRARLAPLYDIATSLPYHRADIKKLKLAMRIGREYLLEHVNAYRWENMAIESDLSVDYVLGHVGRVAEHIGDIVEEVRESMVQSGLTHPILGTIVEILRLRAQGCMGMIRARA